MLNEFGDSDHFLYSLEIKPVLVEEEEQNNPPGDIYKTNCVMSHDCVVRV